MLLADVIVPNRRGMHMNPEKHRIILVAAKPGIMRNSLLSYLRAVLGIRPIVTADDAVSACQMIRECNPELIVVDSDLSESEMLNVIRCAHAEPLHAKTIALVESLSQQELCLAMGATHTSLKGFLDKQLREAVLNEINQTNQ